MAEATMVKNLRQKTGARLMDCSEALDASNGNLDAAVDWLRKKNLDTGSDVFSKPAGDGLLAVLEDSDGVTIVELSSNTDFVAGNAEFRSLLNEIVHVAHDSKLSTVEAVLACSTANGLLRDRIRELAGKMGENIALRRVVHVGGNMGFYVHFDNKQAAVIELDGASGDIARKIGKDISMHIVFAKPSFLTRAEVPEQIVNAERKLAAEKITADPRNASKPPEILAKITDGQMSKYYSKAVLLDQPYYKEEKRPVSAILRELGVTVKQFYRFHVGVI